MHKKDAAILLDLIAKYGVALVADKAIRYTFGASSDEAGRELQCQWEELVSHTDFHDTIHSQPCRDCGDPSGEDYDAPVCIGQHLCPGCKEDDV